MKSVLMLLAGAILGAGAISLAATDERPTYIPAAAVTAAFEKGQPLLETPDYKIHASRRVEAGQAEVHTRDTDIIYVLQGSVTFVTGGTVIDPQTTAADEIRGARIEGGTTRALNTGDVMVVPAGVPHWFSQVDETFLYYVVKATAPETARGTR